MASQLAAGLQRMRGQSSACLANFENLNLISTCCWKAGAPRGGPVPLDGCCQILGEVLNQRFPHHPATGQGFSPRDGEISVHIAVANMNKTCASTMPLTTLFCATISFLRVNIQYLSCVSSAASTHLLQRHNQSDFQGWENATLPVNTEAERKGEERGRGGWDEIHQIWWHGDVDNVFCVQLREGKVEHSHFAPSLPLFLTQSEPDARASRG